MTEWQRINHAECIHGDEYSSRRQCRFNQRKAQAAPEPPETKLCKKCRQVKSANQFGKLRHATSGLHYTCHACLTKSKLKMSRAQKQIEIEKQDYKCAICQCEASRFAADHNHETGEFRGMLCWGCNIGVGWLENKRWRKRAIAYIRGEL